MKYKKPRKTKGRMKSGPHRSTAKCRVPRNYPWVVLKALLQDLRQWITEEDVKHLTRLIRERDLDGYLSLSALWGLQSISCDALQDSIETIRVKLLLSAVLKKFPFPGDSSARRAAAIRNVLLGEEDCRLFNVKRWHILFDEDGKPSSALEHARTFVERVLGVLDEDKVQIWCRHGPGSSTGTSKGKVTAYYKYVNWPYHVTPRAACHAQRLIRSDQRWINALEESYRQKHGIERYHILNWDEFWGEVLSPIGDNRITTVPKDCRKDRPIAIEPTLNLMLQLGVDGFIRRRLKRWGIDLDSQRKNQELARQGSIRKDVMSPVTIDLSNASDTISLRICKLLLPADWYDYVTSIRSPSGRLPNGLRLRYRKLSSMGNGATFAIESLVFASLAYAASMMVLGHYDRDLISIYGDDIIVPQCLADTVIWLIEAFGFSLNMEKSFLDGPVRESCGCDWINGRMVRPVHLKRFPQQVPHLYAHRNRLARWAQLMVGTALPETDKLFGSWVPDHWFVVGPLSDEEFSGYWHSTTKPSYTDWSYEFQCIAEIPDRKRGPQFFFRRLMHPLRQGISTIPDYSDKDSALSAVSSAFTVTERNRTRCRMITRRTPNWQDEYSMSHTSH